MVVKTTIGGRMCKIVAFIGHRRVNIDKVYTRLYEQVLNYVNNGCRKFLMGVHGDFDKLALRVCREIRKTYSDIIIEVVFTSIKKACLCEEGGFNEYEDVVKTVYEIENEYYKRQIIESNKQMIDECTDLICYVDEKRLGGGAKLGFKYAYKNHKKIVNLYNDDDNVFHGLSDSQFNEKIKELCKKMDEFNNKAKKK